MNSGILAIICIAIPILSTPLLCLFNRSPNIRDTISLIAGILMCASAILILPEVLQGKIISIILWEAMPNLPIMFKIEPLGALFGVISSLLWVTTTIYSIGYMRANNEQNQTRFYICFALALGCSAGVAYAGNMFTLFLFYEALTLTTYPLVTHSGTPESRKSGRIYLGVLLATSIMFQLLAMLWTWVEVESLDFVPGGLLSGKVADSTMMALFILYIFGVGKAAIMPFHRWLPAAMVAPAPVSALLHAVAVVKAGVFTILKLSLYLFGLETISGAASGSWLIFVAGFTIIVASVIAFRQDNLKMRLAYSTIGQLSYVVLAAALANTQAFTAGTFHIAAHAFGKITLFFCAGAIYTATGKTKVSELSGIGRKMPITFIAFAAASLVMIGLPPSSGFITKWYLVNGALKSESWFSIIVILGGTLLAAGYLIPIVLSSFFGTSNFIQDNKNSISNKNFQIPKSQVIALSITAILAIGLFAYPNIVLNLAKLAIGE